MTAMLAERLENIKKSLIWHRTGVDPEQKTHQSQEVDHNQAEEEQVVWVQLKADDPQGHHSSQQPQYDVNHEDRWQDQPFQLNPHGWDAPSSTPTGNS